MRFRKRRRFWRPQRLAWRYATRERQGQMRRRIGLLMEQRLGKTPVAIRRMALEGGRKLIVAWATNCHDIIEELRLEGHGKETGVLVGKKPDEQMKMLEDPSLKWFVINYERLVRNPELVDYGWKCIAIDESTAIRNPKAKTTKILVKRTQHIPVRIIMSGLPHPESVLDYFCQMTFLFGSFMGHDNFWAWRGANFHQGTSYAGNKLRWLWVPNKGVYDEIKRLVHKRCFVLTRKQAGMGEKIIRQTRYIALPPRLKKLYRTAERDWELLGEETKWTTVSLVWLARIAGGCALPEEHRSMHKVKELERIVCDELPRDKIVVWFRFNAEIDACERHLRRCGVKVAGITGRTKPAERMALRRDFNRGRIRVLLVQGKCGRFGWNLAAADTAVYFSRHYDGEINAQTADRIVHFTKKRPLLYIDLVTSGTIDEIVVACVRGKMFDHRRFQSKLLRRLRHAA